MGEGNIELNVLSFEPLEVPESFNKSKCCVENCQ